MTEDLGTTTEVLGTTTEVLGTMTDDLGTTTEVLGTVPEVLGTTTEDRGTMPEDPRTATDDLGTMTDDLGAMTELLGTTPKNLGTATDDLGTTTEGLRATTEVVRSAPDDTPSPSSVATNALPVHKAGRRQVHGSRDGSPDWPCNPRETARLCDIRRGPARALLEGWSAFTLDSPSPHQLPSPPRAPVDRRCATASGPSRGPQPATAEFTSSSWARSSSPSSPVRAIRRGWPSRRVTSTPSTPPRPRAWASPRSPHGRPRR